MVEDLILDSTSVWDVSAAQAAEHPAAARPRKISEAARLGHQLALTRQLLKDEPKPTRTRTVETTAWRC
jgi:hypothetical protein